MIFMTIPKTIEQQLFFPLIIIIFFIVFLNIVLSKSLSWLVGLTDEISCVCLKVQGLNPALSFHNTIL